MWVPSYGRGTAKRSLHSQSNPLRTTDFLSFCAERSGVAESIISLTSLDTATTRSMTMADTRQ